MTPARATRPVLIAVALALAGCGAVEGDAHRFQGMAEHVAAVDIPLIPARDGAASAVPHRRTAAEAGLRPARFSPVQVAVMDPHDMWDARDAQASGLRATVERATRPAVEAAVETAAPVVARTMVHEAAARVEAPRLRPAVIRETGRTIQLGAYSSAEGARAAWGRLRANADLADLSPVFESVEVGGRSLTRLKVGPIPAEAAATVCRAAQVADPWCARQG